MNTLQSWLVVGVPGLALAAGLFAGRSPLRSWFGYLALTLVFVFFLLVTRSPLSAGAVGSIIFLLVAAGRGDPRVEQEEYVQGVPMRVDDPLVDPPERA